MPFANDDIRRERVRAYHRDPANRETISRAKRAYVLRNLEKVREGQRAWIRQNPEKRRAHNAVNNALRLGHLAKEPCEKCGAPAQAHHDDYSKPLDVRWLCRTHHAELHRRIA